MRPLASALLGAGGLLAGSPAQAQVRCAVGPRVGLAVATSSFTNLGAYTSYATATSYRPGVEAGIGAVIGRGHFAVQPAVLYTQRGYYQTQEHVLSTTQLLREQRHVRLDFISLPVNLTFTQHPTGQGYQLLAGPYVSVLMGGRYTSSDNGSVGGSPLATYTSRVRGGDQYTADGEYYTRRVDAGLQAGVGYRYQQFLFQATYSWGLMNQAVTYHSPSIGDYAGPTNHGRAFQLALAYLLGPTH